MDSLRCQVEIAANKESVWQALTKSDKITKWFAPAANIDARTGGEFELFFDPADRSHMCTKGCKITRFEPMDRLGFTWKGPDEFAALMNDEASLTNVLVTFSEENGATLVVVEHSGWGDGSEWEKARSWHQMAWQQALGSLKSALESGEGDLCCSPQE